MSQKISSMQLLFTNEPIKLLRISFYVINIHAKISKQINIQRHDYNEEYKQQESMFKLCQLMSDYDSL